MDECLRINEWFSMFFFQMYFCTHLSISLTDELIFCYRPRKALKIKQYHAIVSKRSVVFIMPYLKKNGHMNQMRNNNYTLCICEPKTKVKKRCFLFSACTAIL